MAASPTVPPKDEIRHVVIEPEKPAPSRPKQFITLKPLDIGKERYKAFEYVLITEEEATPFIASRFLVPFDVALREGIYPPASNTPTHKITEKIKEVVEDVTGIEMDTNNPPEEPPKKSFLGNSLRDAIQAQKAKIDASKLAAIRAGGNK